MGRRGRTPMKDKKDDAASKKTGEIILTKKDLEKLRKAKNKQKKITLE